MVSSFSVSGGSTRPCHAESIIGKVVNFWRTGTGSVRCATALAPDPATNRTNSATARTSISVPSGGWRRDRRARRGASIWNHQQQSPVQQKHHCERRDEDKPAREFVKEPLGGDGA